MDRDGRENGRPEVVVITGASAGVGRATARAFAREGAHVGLIARGTERLEAARREVESLGGRALVLPLDVADADAVDAAASAVEQEFGPIDIWINNAMTAVFAEFTNVEPEEYRRVTEVVYHGTVFGTRSALKRMIPRDRGTVVLVGSALAYRGIPLQSAYCGAKHAIQGMFDSVRAELLHNRSNVHICMVQLPALNTPQFSWVRNKLGRKAQPVPPIYQPEVAADAILWGARNTRREIYVGFPSVKAIVGNKMAPGLGDRYLAATGYDSQQRDEPERPDRPDNLFEPVPGDFSAHGEFDEQATDWSPQLWLSQNRRWLALAGAGLAGAVSAAWMRRTRG
jgi:NADP-dependent 3-hydroxy acid dehydrogenase YdfG